jgi:hypothetical protein
MPSAVIESISYIGVFWGIIISWILMYIWQRWIDLFLFTTLKLDRNSPYQLFIIAITITIMLLLITMGINILTSDVVSPEDPDPSHPIHPIDPMYNDPPSTNRSNRQNAEEAVDIYALYNMKGS